MPRRSDLKSVLVIGSGPIVIGQGCEFDYSGTQACRVLKPEGHPRQPGELQPGDDHDRPGVRRRDLRRADHHGRAGEGDREGAPGRRAAHAGRADRAQRRGRAARGRHADASTASSSSAPTSKRSRRARTASGSRRSSRPSARRSRAAGSATRSRSASTRPRELGLPIVVRPSFTLGGAGSGIAYDEATCDGSRARAWTRARPPRCSSRSRSSAGRSSSSS